MSKPAYFSNYPSIRFERDAAGVLVMSLHSNGGPLTFTAAEHESFVDAFYEVGRDRTTTVLILTVARWFAQLEARPAFHRGVARTSALAHPGKE